MNLFTLIEEVPGIGPQYQKKLKKLGIKTVRDLLFHFPHRYEDFSNFLKISEVKIGQFVCLQGKILEIENTKTWKKKMILTKAILEDKSGAIKVIWFNQPYLINVLRKNDLVCLAGKISVSEDGIYLSNPVYEKITQKKELLHTGRIVPVYPETEGLSSRWLRNIIQPILTKLKNKIPETLPQEILEKHKFLSIYQALWQVHFPDSLKLAKLAKERFSFEEIFYLALLVQREKQRISKEKAASIALNISLIKEFVNSLPFKLTNAQKKSAWQILKDLQKPKPMNRLLEGDVGSGKTVVAAIAALNVAKAGYQIAFMAPTEILAKQHFKTFVTLLRNFNLKIGLLTGKEAKIFHQEEVKISPKKIIKKTEEGEIDILLGTHSLIQDRVLFKNLALVIVDEQHRFGIEQRAKLCKPKEASGNKILIPHLLSMTATPIPRTLALTLYGDLDLSLIDELPKGRKKIITKIVPPEKRKLAYKFIKNQVKEGRQVFVICPRIEQKNKKTESQENKITSWAETRAVKEEYEKLSKIIFPDLKIAYLHGKMKASEKEKIMEDFKNKKIDILVSTSVVEVGVDVPNATVMMIEGAERFGLAQLHQFRGRVGRGEHQSFCFLFTDSPAKKTQMRLKALISCENGFKLAEKDLEIRGPGALDGIRQWGMPDLAMSALLKDLLLVQKAKMAAKEILEKDPELKNYPFLKEKLKELRERIHLE